MEIKNNFIEEILSVAWPRLRTKLLTPKDPHCIDVLVEVANELYGMEVAYELHKNLSNGVYVAENNPLNYKKLKEDFWVKNKESGNVYTVKNQNPEIHTEPSKDEIEAAKKDKSANTDNTQSSEPTSYIGAAAGFGNRVLTKVKNWTRQEKEYFQKGYHKPGSEQRRSIATAFKDKLKGAWKAAKDGLKHEVHTFKTAAVGVSKWMNGAPLTSEETKAITTVVKHVAVTALMAFAGGGLAHGAAAFAKHVAIELVPHVVAETILVGVGRAALFADADSEAETDLNFQKFGEMVADGLENMEISPEQMEAMVDSYEEKKKSGEIKIQPDTDQTPPTKETPKAKPEEEEDPLEKDLDSVKFGMMTGAEKDAYFKKKREKSDRLGEDIWIQNKDSHNFYQVDKFNPENHEPPTADELEMLKTPGKQSQKPPTKSKQTQKIADNLKGRKDSDGNTLDAETTNNGSLILGVEHGEGTESTKQSIKQIQSLPKDTKVMFVGEGGMTRDDNGNLELAGEQAEFRDATREHFSNWEESSWDENANVYDGDSPVYDFVAQSLGGSKSKAFAAVWSNMVGQMPNGQGDMDADDYLDDEGKEWLINQAKKGGSKEFDGDVDWNNLTDEQWKDLYELNFRDDNRLGETEISKSQEAYNNFRQKELDRKIKEAEDEGYTVIAPVGNSHVDLWRQRNKPKTESILRKIGISNWEFTQLLKEFSLISEADDIDMQSVLDSKVLNPDTNRQIKVSTGLGYDKATGGYQAAKAKMADSGISDEETEKAEKEKSNDNSEEQLPKTPSEIEKYVNNKIKKNEENFNNAKNKEQYALSVLSNRQNEINNNFLRPAGSPGSSFAEVNGAKYVNYIYSSGGKMTSEQEKQILDDMMSSPIAQEIPPKDRLRWAKIALKTAKSEAKVLMYNSKYKAKQPQRSPFPQGVIMDKQSKSMVQTLLSEKLKSAKTPEQKKHYQKQLDYLEKLKESDTGILYEMDTGEIGFKHTSNKSSYRDPHNNTSVRQRIKGVSDNLPPNEPPSPTFEAGMRRVEDKVSAANNGLESAAKKFAENDSSVDIKTKNKRNGLIARISSEYPTRGGQTKNYLNDVREKKWAIKKAKELGIKTPLSDQDVVTVAFACAAEPPHPADALKILTKVSELLEAVTDKNIESVAKKFGVSKKELEFLIKTTSDLKNAASTKRDIMKEAHDEVVKVVQEEDKKQKPAVYPYDKNADNGTYQQAYVADYLDKMHFTDYILGKRDGVSSHNIDGDNVEPEYYRQCLAQLSGFKGKINSDSERNALLNHLKKRLRMDSKDGSILFVNGTTKSELGTEVYRTKGDSKSIVSGLGGDLQKCLKQKANE